MYAMEVVKPYKSKAKYIIVESIDINTNVITQMMDMSSHKYDTIHLLVY